MERENDSGQDEWVNAWAAYKGPEAPTEKPEIANGAPLEGARPVAVRAPVSPRNQLALDIAAIARRRDALNAMLIGPARPMPPLRLVASRTDRAPAIVGGVIALVILTVFGAAAAMSRLH